MPVTANASAWKSRIFDETDTAIIGPGTGNEYEIESESVFSAGVEYLIEGVSGGKELFLSLTCKDEDDKVIGTDSMKVSTVGMSVVSGFSTGSIHRVMVENLKIDNHSTCFWYGNVETMPAHIVMRLKENVEIGGVLDSNLCRPLDIYGNEWEGRYWVCNQEFEPAWPLNFALIRDEYGLSLWYIIYNTYYDEYVRIGVKSQYSTFA